MKKRASVFIIFIILSLLAVNNFAIQRFPKPEFESKYTQPDTQLPAPRSIVLEYLDVTLLIACLALITWFILK
jgi:NosR/NirI family nitrous oxide reductase transcriptional regulator